MDCRDMTEFMLSMDNTTDLPPEVEQHLRGCGRCSREFDQWAVAVGSLRIESGGLEDSVLTDRVMRAVRSEAPRTEEQPTPLRNWIIVGTVLLGGIFGLRFSDAMDWLRTSFGPAIDVAMILILGVFLTGYICMLVASNLRRVLRVFRVR